MSRANTDKPRFAVISKVGMYLAKNPKASRNMLPVCWVRDRANAETFTSWSEAAVFGNFLPTVVQNTSRIVDQHDKPWTADEARKVKVFEAKREKPVKKTEDTPAALAKAA